MDEICVILFEKLYGIKPIARQYDQQDLYSPYNGYAYVVAMVDSSTSILSSYDQDIYGKMKTVNEQKGKENPIRYAGQYYDEDSGLYYLRARYYDPGLMRFSTEDTYKGDVKDPLSLNLYAYCKGNPILYVDLTGHEPGTPYGSVDEAAIDFAKRYNQESIDKDIEMIAAIYIVMIDGIVHYTYTDPQKEDPNLLDRPDACWAPVIPEGVVVVAEIHTHGKYDPNMGKGNDEFSDGYYNDNPNDIPLAQRRGINIYVATPQGELLKYDVANDIIIILPVRLAFDHEHPFWRKKKGGRASNNNI